MSKSGQQRYEALAGAENRLRAAIRDFAEQFHDPASAMWRSETIGRVTAELARAGLTGHDQPAACTVNPAVPVPGGPPTLYNTLVPVVANLLAASPEAAIEFLSRALQAAGFDVFDDKASMNAFEAEDGTTETTLPGRPPAAGPAVISPPAAALARQLADAVRSLDGHPRADAQASYPVQIAIAIIDGHVTGLSAEGQELLALKLTQLAGPPCTCPGICPRHGTAPYYGRPC